MPEPIQFPDDEPERKFKAATLKIPGELEPYIQLGMKRTGKTRHGYLIAAVRFVAMREKTK